MAGYTKLFNSILDSTIWDESNETRLLWITMLAMVNKHGEVLASVNTLVNRSRLSLTAVNNALEKLLATDWQSRTPDNAGRRIEKIDGGWKLLNYQKYRKKRDRATYMREYMRRYRSVNHGEGENVSRMLATCKPVLANSIYTTSDKVSTNTSEYNPPIIPPKFVNKVVNKVRICRMPGCNNPVGPTQAFCSQACYDYAVLLETKYANGETKR